VTCSYVLGCSLAQADHIIKLRPFANVEDLTAKLHQGKKRAGPGGISTRMFQDCTNIFAGYSSVDSVLDDCERIGTQLRSAIASWTSADPSGKTRSGEQDMGLANGETDDGALSLTALVPGKGSTSKDCLTVQPTLLSNDIKLKDYQLTGVSWLRLVYRKRLSCILADEMGQYDFLFG
jgi:SWI/SNF-related matrix-associated actin-dependent regulator 1 of chromatin subfamily A